jgi:hypothetical protein
MDAVTYPNDQVAAALNEGFIAFKPEIGKNARLAKGYGVVWTPGLLWLDAEGTVRHNNVGFFEPEELLAELDFGRGRVLAAAGDWEAARRTHEAAIERWPNAHATPAARYWAGVAAKKATGEAEPLVKHWKALRRAHPDSAWAMKVSFVD